MGPSRHTRTAAAASAGSSSHRDDESAPASASPSKTPVRPSPYARTPTKPSSSSALTLGPSTPTSRTNSPMMLREIFSMISPFRSLSRARRSAAFGAADEGDADQDTSNAASDDQLARPSKLQDVQDVGESLDVDDRMIEDAEEGVSQNAHSSRLEVPNTYSAPRSPSPKPRSPFAAPPKSLPLADSTLVTPGLRRKFANARSTDSPSMPGPSTSYAPPTQTSPVSRNYDLLARFFSEKQRGGQGGLTEVEVEGCIRLIEESMASGRNLESEFAGSSNYGRTFTPVQTGGFAPSSRASSIAPPAFPSSQSTNTLFHPGTSKLPTSSSAYSFLAPRASAPRTGFGAAPSTTRRRPIYLGPGMSGLSLNRRRPVVASASRAAALAKTPAQGFLPRSSTDPNLVGLARQADDLQESVDRAEEAKRRRTVVDAANAAPSTQARGLTASHTVQFEPAYEKEAHQSSLLAKDIAAPSSSINGTSGSPLKRAAPSAESTAATTTSTTTNPPKATTRTASAIQDILKTTPPVRPPTKPELVNPYQSAAPLAAKSKSSTEADSTPVRRSARASMLTRAKARETARADEKLSPPKESVLDLIERTAPKNISKRKAASEVSDPERSDKAAVAKPEASAAAVHPSPEERKLQKTEEVQRRLEALNQSKGQQPQQNVSKPAVADPKSSKVSANLVPPQYTATKPKKPSPLSAAFQAPDSPSSDSETTATTQSRGPAISQPTFSFGSATAANVAKPVTPSTGFSFSAPKPASASATTAAPAPASAAPSSGFSFSKPAASAPEPAKAASAPSTSFSFSPVTAAPAQPKPATGSTPASTDFNFSAPSSAPTSTPEASTSTVGTSQSSSVRDQVLAEDASKLAKFDWQVPAVSATVSANQALRDEIKSVAQAALPKFDFIYDIEISADGEKAAPAKAAASSTGFSFSSSQAAPAAASSSTTAETTATSNDSAPEDTGADDPSKPSSSGLLGEGEGEESERTLFEVRAKIWRLDVETKSWKDLGVCIAKIKHDSSTNKHRLLARNEANGKVAVNFRTYKGLKTTLDKTVNAFLGFDGQNPTQYRMKVKSEESASEFKKVLEGAAP